MKKYTTDWRATIITFGILAVCSASIFYLTRNPEMSVLGVIIGLAAWFVFVALGVLFMTVFSYASISERTLKYVWLFFLRRTINIDSITDISDQPMFKVVKSQFRSLYIFYNDKSGDKKWIEFRITIFPEKTLGRLIKDLKNINPNIKLNTYSEKLIKLVS